MNSNASKFAELPCTWELYGQLFPRQGRSADIAPSTAARHVTVSGWRGDGYICQLQQQQKLRWDRWWCSSKPPFLLDCQKHARSWFWPNFTGLQINYHKSTFVPINVDEQIATEAAHILGCPISVSPCTYLELPLSMNKITLVDLIPVIQKIDKRLAGWICTFLSWGGRLTMINAVLSAIPTHYMTCFIWPGKGIDLIDKLRRLFLWDFKDGNGAGHCLVAWDCVVQNRKCGGLAIQNLKAHNAALLCKFLSKVLQSTEIPCYQWLASWYLKQDIHSNWRIMTTVTWRAFIQFLPIVQY